MANPRTTLSCRINLAGKTNLCDVLHSKLVDILKKYSLVVLLLLSQNISQASTLAQFSYELSTNSPPSYTTSISAIAMKWCNAWHATPGVSNIVSYSIINDPATTNIVRIQCVYQYVGSSTLNYGIAVFGASCPVTEVLTSWTGDGYICGTGPLECTPPLVPDATGTRCVTQSCPVPALAALPADDKCAQSLNKGLGTDVDGKCPELNARMTGPNGQLQCFANKIAATNVSAYSKIPYSGPSAEYRNAAYQQHLLDIWNKMIEFNKSENRNNEACRSRRDQVIAEKGCSANNGCSDVCITGSHCIRNAPATFSNHTEGKAFDVPKDTISGLLSELTPLPPAPMTGAKLLQARRFWIASWLAKPPACNLGWGGNFTNPGPDFVHFQLP